MTPPPDLVDRDAIVAMLMARIEEVVGDNSKQTDEIEWLAMLVAESEARLAAHRRWIASVRSIHATPQFSPTVRGSRSATGRSSRGPAPPPASSPIVASA